MPETLPGEEAGDGAQVSAVTITSRRAPSEVLPRTLRGLAGGGSPRRSWTPLGTLASGVVGDLDASGSVQLTGRSWSLDWWVGAQDRWHHPSLEASLRQGPLEASPALHTVLRVPDGHVVHRVVAGVTRSAGTASGGSEAVVVEVENRSPVPVALALVVRPWNLDGPGSLSSVELAEHVVKVDGRPSIVLPRRPARVAHGPGGTVAVRLARGDDEAPVPVLTGEGDLEVALVFPLAHGATLRAILPVGAEVGRRGRNVVPEATGLTAPSVESVVKGWAVHDRGDPTAGLPVADWAALVSWSGAMLRITGPQEVTRALDPSAIRPTGADAARRLGAVVAGLGGLDVPELHDAVAHALSEAQRRDGAVRMADGSDATESLLLAAAATLGGPRRGARAEELLGPVAAALRRLRRRGDTTWSTVRREAVARSRIAPALAAIGQPELAAEALELPGGGLELPGGRTWPRDRRDDAAPEGSTFEIAEALHHGLLSGRPGVLDELSRHLARRGTAGAGDAIDADGHWSGVLGFDAAELAELRLALLDLLACDGPSGPLLFVGWRSTWAGQDLECRRVPTAWGRVSCALRWHGHRPAVLWEIEPVLGTRSSVVPELRAPTLDPTWRASGWAGEALLSELRSTVER